MSNSGIQGIHFVLSVTRQQNPTATCYLTLLKRYINLKRIEHIEEDKLNHG